MRRVRGEASTHKQPPTSAMESASGQCSKGGPHRWRFGKCAACGKAEGVEAKQRQIQRAVSKEAEPYLSAEATRQSCPTCGFGWHDAYGKPECPKCLQPLGEIKPKRCVGEVSTYKHPPISAMESMSGACPVAGVHSWRFGKCTHCGKAEGNEAKEKQIRRIEDVEEARRERVEACKRSGLDYDHLGEARICKLNTTDTPKICPHCTFAWHDAYGKNECPKCLRPLVGEVYVRAPGHESISTDQQTQRQVRDEPVGRRPAVLRLTAHGPYRRSLTLCAVFRRAVVGAGADRTRQWPAGHRLAGAAGRLAVPQSPQPTRVKTRGSRISP